MILVKILLYSYIIFIPDLFPILNLNSYISIYMRDINNEYVYVKINYKHTLQGMPRRISDYPDAFAG